MAHRNTNRLREFMSTARDELTGIFSGTPDKFQSHKVPTVEDQIKDLIRIFASKCDLTFFSLLFYG